MGSSGCAGVARFRALGGTALGCEEKFWLRFKNFRGLQGLGFSV